MVKIAVPCPKVLHFVRKGFVWRTFWRLGGTGLLVGACVYALGVGAGEVLLSEAFRSIAPEQLKPKAWAANLVRHDSACETTPPIGEPGCQDERTHPCDPKEVGLALPDWSKARTQNAAERYVSALRHCRLSAALHDTSSAAFPDARAKLVEEDRHYDALRLREKQLALSPRETQKFCLFGLVDVAVAASSLWLLVQSGRLILRGQTAKLAAQRHRAHWWILGGAVPVATLPMWLNRDVSHKLSVGLDSYVATPSVWYCNVVVAIGVAILFSQPMALLWTLSQSALIPRLKLNAPRGDCGVGSYVTFLHTWTILAFAFALLPAIPFVRYLNRSNANASESPYLVPVFFGIGLTSLIVGRLIKNAVTLRCRYQYSLRHLGKTWTDVYERKPAQDPTIHFIGENWWKLPATLGSMAAAYWTILAWTGLAKTLTDALFP